MNVFDTPVHHPNENARRERLKRQSQQAKRNTDARRIIERRAEQKALDELFVC